MPVYSAKYAKVTIGGREIPLRQWAITVDRATLHSSSPLDLEPGTAVHADLHCDGFVYNISGLIESVVHVGEMDGPSYTEWFILLADESLQATLLPDEPDVVTGCGEAVPTGIFTETPAAAETEAVNKPPPAELVPLGGKRMIALM